MIGPVHENDTNARVKAIRNMLSTPLVDDALLSTAFPHLSGRRISNHPKNEKAKIISSKQKSMLKTAFVDNELRADAPNAAVTASPKAT